MALALGGGAATWLASGGVAAAAANPPAVIGRMAEHRAAYRDTFADLARRYNLGFVELVAANPGVDPWLPGEGQRIVLPSAHLLPAAPHEGVVVNLVEMRLYAFGAGGAPMATHPLGVGREGRSTPVGSTTIVRKLANPSWTPPASVRAENPDLPQVVPAGPDNPLGEHALYLGWPAYLIHGTNKPAGVGRRVSAGCLRMYPEDVARLYETVPVGTRVTVVRQPVKFGWIGDALHIEVHPSAEQADEIEATGRFTRTLPDDLIERVLVAAGSAAERLDWDAIRLAAVERRGYPVRISRGRSLFG